MAIPTHKTSLQGKLGIKPKHLIDIINPPDNYMVQLGELPVGVQQDASAEEMDLIQIFATDRKQLAGEFSKAKSRLKMDGMLWVSWPKQSSTMATELRESVVREIGLGQGMVDVKVIAVDETWSGLKFVYRLEDRT